MSLLRPKRWQMTFTTLHEDGDSLAYQRYKQWCQAQGYSPAAYDIWAREYVRIGELGGMKER